MHVKIICIFTYVHNFGILFKLLYELGDVIRSQEESVLHIYELTWIYVI